MAEDIVEVKAEVEETEELLPILPAGISDKQKTFLNVYFSGERDLVECARLAGYADEVAAARRLMRSPKIRAAIQGAASDKLAAYGNEALDVLRMLMYSQDEKVAVSAAKSIADRAGHVAASSSIMRGKEAVAEPETPEDIRSMLQEIQRFSQATLVEGTAQDVGNDTSSTTVED